MVSALEPRVMLSAVTVSSAADNTTADDELTLREAVAILNDGNIADGVAGLGGRMLTANEAARIDLTDPFGTNDTVRFAAALNGTPILLDGTTFGDIDITTSMTILGNGAANTVIDAQQLSRIFHVAVSAGDVTLQGVTLSNGLTTGDFELGGAVRSNSNGTLAIVDSVVSGNRTEGNNAYGGAIWSDDAVTVSRSEFRNNSTLGGAGRGGAIDGDSTVTVEDSLFDGNSTVGIIGYGGAIAASGAVTVTNSTFRGNSTGELKALGGAIFSFANVTVTNSALSGNHTTGDDAYGGAIFSGDVATVTNSTLSGNYTTGDHVFGGAVVANNAVTITNSTLSGNFTTGQSSQGGAVAADGTVTVTNSTLSGNSVTGQFSVGGAIFTINGHDVTIRNSIVAGNSASFGNPEIRSGGTLTVDHSLIGDNSGTGLAADPDASISNGTQTASFIGTAAAPIDPMLGPLASNGGPTKTHALLPGSLALDSGDDDLAVDPADGDAPLTTDQRGAPFSRIFGAAVDMGAYERQTVAGLNLIVDNATDEDDGDYSAGDLSLREAVGLANGSLGADTITFATALNGTPILLRGDVFGDIDITDTVVIMGNGAPETVIDARQLSRVFNVSGVDVSLTLDGATLQNGLVAGRGGAIVSTATGTTSITIVNTTLSGNSAEEGGAIYANYGQVTVTDTTLSGNSADENGGAIFSENGDVVINSSTLSGNSADENGGAIFSDSGDVVINSSTLSGNSAEEGGAIYANHGQVTVTDTTLSDNDAEGNGGAIFSDSGDVVINSSTLSGNSADEGGAIYASEGQVAVTDTTLSGNSADGNGGAILSNEGDVVIKSSTLSGNSADTRGGGAFAELGDLFVFNSTISGNFAMDVGGGLYAEHGEITLINSTVTLNQAGRDGAAAGTRGDVTIHNSIVAGNIGPTEIDAANIFVFHSLIGDNAGTTLDETGPVTPDANGNYIGGSGGGIITGADLGLAPLAFNGGPTQTHALLSTSLALNSGDDDLAVDDMATALVTDQRGAPFARIFGTAVDMGAYERQSLTLVVDNATDEDDGDYSAGDLSLREAVRLANANAGIADTITFAAALDGTPILLTMGQMTITESVTVTGNGVASTIIDGQRQSRLFLVNGVDVDVTFDSLTLYNGRTTAANEGGGAVRLDADTASTVAIRNSLVVGNTTSGSLSHGGAVWSQLGQVFVTGSTFTQNETQAADADGGAIYSRRNNVGGVDLATANSTFSGNSAGRHGGSIFVYSAILMNNVTVTDNEAGGDGGGLAIDIRGSDVKLYNSIIAGNTDAGGDSPDFYIRVITSNQSVFSHNLIGDAGGSFLVPTGGTTPDANGNYIGFEGTPIDSGLGALGDNGGPTPTHALLPNSLALNHGDNAQAVDPSSGNAPLTTDQRGSGFDRTVGGMVDMGAYEFQVPVSRSFVVDNATDEDDGDYSTGDLSLREAVRLANENAGAEDTITFAPALNGTTILVTLGQMTITDSVIITGNGAANTVLDAGQNSRFFEVNGDGADFTLEGVTLKNGRTTMNDDGGGAIFSNSASANLVTIRDSILSDNSTLGGNADGGAIFLSGGNSLRIERSTLTRNEAGGSSSGGAIYAAGTGTLTIVASTLSDNKAVDDLGGAIFSFFREVAVRESTLSGNRADVGGAFFGVVGTITFTNSTLSGNQSTGDGAGFFLQFAGLTLTNSTVTQNHSDRFGGGITTNGNGAVLTINNSIVSDNTAAQFAPDLYQGSAAAATVRNSLIGDNQGSGLAATGGTTPGTNGNFIGTHTRPIDAGLAPLANNGGPTMTHALLTGSRAINRGSNALATDPADGNAPLTTDQRGTGFARIRSGTVDIGALEYAAPPVIRNFGTGLYWIEGRDPVPFSSLYAVVTDADSPNFNGGTLTVELTNNARPGDVLGIRNQGTGVGQISIGVDTIFYRPTTASPPLLIGTFAGGTDGAPLVITFTTADATLAAVTALIRNLTFSSTSDNPTNAVRTLRLQVSDGNGGVSVPLTKNVSVIPRNDAPTINGFDGSVTFTEHGSPVLLDADATLFDPDSADFGGGVLQVRAVKNGQTTDVLTIANRTTDSGDVVAWTAGKVFVNGVQVGTASGGTSGGTLTVSFNTQATPARAAAVLQSIQFANTSHTPSPLARTIRVYLTDGDGASVVNTLKLVNVVPVNDAPVIGGVTSPVLYRGTPLLPFPSAVLTDIDTTLFTGGTLTIQPTNGAMGDLIGIRNQGVRSGQIGVSNDQIKFGNVVIGTFTGGANGTALVITLNDKATKAAVQALMRNVQFTTTNLGSLPRTLSMTLGELDGTNSNTVTQTVNDAAP